MKLTISVWYKDEDGDFCKRELRNLKPRLYMLGYSFERLLRVSFTVPWMQFLYPRKRYL